jgi:hypothetical protein
MGVRVTTPAAEQTDVETIEADVDSYKTQHAKVLRFELSIGASDDDRTLEQFEQDIREALVQGMRGEPINNITYQSGYYIIDGKVCLTQDYDHATKNRKPGTYPPVWAGGPDPKKPQRLIIDDDEDSDKPREFVRVQPTINTQRDPLTGRRIRKDKGVKRGPRTATDDKLDMKAKVAELGEQMKEAQSE